MGVLVALAGLAALMAIPVWGTLRWAPPPPLTALTATRHLLTCCAVVLLGLVARQDPLLAEWWPWALGASVVCTGLLVIVLVGEQKGA